MYAGPGRPPRRVHRVGSGRAQEGLGDQGELPGLERRARDRRRRRLLRHDGRLVQGASMRRRGTLLWQFKTELRHHRPADAATAAPTASSTSPCWPGVGGWAGAIVVGRPRSRATAPPALGFVNAMKDLPQHTHEGRHAVCLRAARDALLRAAPSLRRAGGARSPQRCRAPHAAAARRLRVCADPDNLPYSHARRQRLREPHRASWSPTSCSAPLEYDWLPQRRGFVRKTLGAGLCDVLIGVPAGFERVLTTRPYYRSSYVFVERADARAPLRSFDDPRLRAAAHRRAADRQRPRRHAARPRARARAARSTTSSATRSTATARRPQRMVARARARRARRRARLGAAGRLLRDARARVPLAVAARARRRPSCALPFEFAIAMGVRRGDAALRDALDAALARRARRHRRDPRRVRACRADAPSAPRERRDERSDRRVLSSPRCSRPARSPAASARSAQLRSRRRSTAPTDVGRSVELAAAGSAGASGRCAQPTRRRQLVRGERVRREPGQAPVPLVQLQRLPRQRRRRHGPGADGRRLALRQRAGAASSRRIIEGPPERHAVVRRPHPRRPGLAARRLRALA